ncbi:putative Protease [Thiomonas sp. X19]|uniref:CPBP family intramembrane glutamic endopeptidase n=1 Tax=Thiomonas sp. X19 TaxID=1050370 RepID=UPI000B703D51|nr:CPBP family intramembrane glutamic endopeptidase [Thiomonas sp. X19]SCC92885.1 putative Protease [Thiomonas sp. X19]
MEVTLASVIVLGATAVILNLGRFANKSPYSVSVLEYINTQSKYQALLLSVAGVVLFCLYSVNAANLWSFLTPGKIAAPAKGVPWLGISDNQSWASVGASLSFFITLATSTFVYLQFRKSGEGLKQALPYLPWVLLFSLTNSFSEEVVYRLGIIVPLVGSVDTNYILLFSAAAFGAPHLRGMPNGIVGALMAGFLGWLLAKSMIETNGIFWAWFIHFLQDIVIFSAFVMAAANRAFERDAPKAARPSI